MVAGLFYQFESQIESAIGRRRLSGEELGSKTATNKNIRKVEPPKVSG
jgi:hypothetical protein